MNPADLQLSDTVDALKAMVLASRPWFEFAKTTPREKVGAA
jgi:hypothetical protein